MALQFTTDLISRDGFVVSNAYGRVTATDQLTGTFIKAHVDFYQSQESFESGIRPFKTQYIQDAHAPYDRAVDGVDVLNIAHDALIAQLAEQGIVATKEL